MRRFIRALSIAALLCIALASFVGSRPASAAALEHKASSEQAVKAYVAAIRYFNPGIDEDEARHIVVAIARESLAKRVDPRLIVAIVATESSFDRTARSSAGAMGLGQLMPATAADDRVTNANDIDQNIRGTVLTLKGNLQHYSRLDQQHQYVYAIAAYNAGTGAVDEYGGVPPYDETIHYVWKVVALWRRLWGMSAT
jgi:soluble lytic murein transglycosylase-like protein